MATGHCNALQRSRTAEHDMEELQCRSMLAMGALHSLDWTTSFSATNLQNSTHEHVKFLEGFIICMRTHVLEHHDHLRHLPRRTLGEPVYCVTRTTQARQVAPRATTRGTAHHATSHTQHTPTHPRNVSTRAGHSHTAQLPSVGFFRGAARLAAYVLVTQPSY